MDAYPSIPKLPWTRLEIALLIASSLGVIVGLSAFALGWRVSPAWGRENLQPAILLCILYAGLGASARGPSLYAAGGPSFA
jgi:hypothetical protein